MKRILVGTLALAATSVSAAGMPTVYGLINKEIRSVSQDDAAGKASYTGVTDVDGFETRLAAKGSHELKHDLKLNYKMELGINSNRDGANGDRIRIRLAQADLMGAWGTLTVGQAWQQNTLRMLNLDPFTATGAQLLGLESGDVTGAVSGNFGMRARYFVDQLAYTTPDFGGAKFSVTVDTEDDADLTKNADASSSTWYTNLLTFDKDFGGMKLNAHATYALGKNEDDNSDAFLDNDENFMTIGAKFTFGSVAFSAAYTKEERGQTKSTSNTALDVERTHMLATLSYTMDDLMLGLNYGKSEFDDDESAVASSLGTTTTGGEQSQLAVGLTYKLSDMVKTRLIYKTQKTEVKTGTVVGTGTVNENKATSIITGLTVAF